MTFHPVTFGLGIVAVLIKHQIFFKLLAGSSQCIGTLLHNCSP
jgi:hypothetical protein